jgi:predicted pPIWI-associating nuclease
MGPEIIAALIGAIASVAGALIARSWTRGKDVTKAIRDTAALKSGALETKAPGKVATAAEKEQVPDVSGQASTRSENSEVRAIAEGVLLQGGLQPRRSTGSQPSVSPPSPSQCEQLVTHISLEEIRRFDPKTKRTMIRAREESENQHASLSQGGREETLIVDTLERLIPSAAASYRQGLADLNDERRHSYRGTASEFREALRETLDHLAPDSEVSAQPGFAYDGDQKKPTMKQKVRYVLNSRKRSKTQRDAAERSTSLVEELSGDVARAVYNHASLAAHVQQSREEVRKIKRYVDTVLFDLLEIS